MSSEELTRMQALYQRAKQVIPYGVNSNFRYDGEHTLVVQRGEGAYLWDSNGKKYIDYRLAFGPIILGYAYPSVVEKVREAAGMGNIFALTTEIEVDLAEQITRLCQVDKVRLTNTGSEATMHALRLARAHTGREKYIKFEGQYHGQVDYFLFSTPNVPMDAIGSRRSPNNVFISSGIPKGISEYVITIPYNDPEMLERVVRARWGEIAAIFLEPIMGTMACVMPSPEFLKTIRSLCDQYGIVMVMDEVKTGFRVANGGAQEYFGVKADLVTYAKALGNGFPIAAFAGKNEVMMTVEPRRVSHAGTYNANVISVAAARATLDVLESEPVIDTLYQRGRALMDGFSQILREAGITHAMQGVPTMFGFILGTDRPATDLRSFNAGDSALHKRIHLGLIERGIFIDSDIKEPWYGNYSLSDQDIGTTLAAFEDAVKAARV
jgi:glutamate-1-semialdehyde 2,1-aminomutase